MTASRPSPLGLLKALFAANDLTTEAGRANERHRRIAMTALAAIFARGISVFATLISVPLTLHYLGPERYGMWMVLNSFIAILSFTDLGVGNGVLTLVARMNGTDDIKGIRDTVSSAISVLVGLSVLLGAVFLAAYGSVAWEQVFNVRSPLAISEAGPAVAVFAACFLLAFPLSIVQAVQAGLQMGFASNLWQGAGAVIGLVSLLAAIHFEASLPWLVFALFGVPRLSPLLANLVFFGFQRPDLRPRLSYVSLGLAKKILRTGVLFLVLQVVTSTVYNSDALIISQFMGAEAVANYAVPERMFLMLSTLLATIAMPLWPAFGEALTRGDMQWVKKSLKRIIVLNVVIAALGSGVLILFGPVLLMFWVGKDISPPLLLLLGFAVWRMLEAVSTPIAALLNGANIVGAQVVLASLTAIVAIPLKILAVQQFGYPGPIWATSISFLVCALVPWLFILRKHLHGK